MSDGTTGVRSNRTLLAQGWERRHLADPARAQEAIKTYEALGFEVRAERLTREDFGSSCFACSAAVCKTYVLIYTRRTKTRSLETNHMQVLQPPNWPRPKGYANGVMAKGTWICVAGQVGWDENESFASRDLVGQSHQALRNIVAVLEQAGAGPAHVVRLTWYVTDKRAYLKNQRALGEVYRDVFGSHFPAMSLVVVAGLVEDGALVEIEATAVLPEGASS